MPGRRMLQAVLALALMAAPASAQDHILAFTIFTGGARFSDMASGGAGEVRLKSGALAGLQAELWLGRFGGRLNLGATQRGLVGDSATSFLLSTVDVDLMARLLPPKPRRFFSPYAAVGLGYAQYDLELDTMLVGGEAYSGNPATLPSGMVGIGADIGAGNLAGRIELYDIVSLRSPLDRPDGSSYGPVQHVVLTLGLSFRMGGSAGPIVLPPVVRPPRTVPTGPREPTEPEEPEAQAPPPDTSPPTVQPPETPGPIPPTERPPTEPETPGPITPPADSTPTPPPPPDTTPRRRPPVVRPRPRPPVEPPDTAPPPPRRRPTQPPDSTPAGPPRGPTMPGGIHTVPPDTAPPAPVDSGPPTVQPPPTPGPKPPPTEPPGPPVQPPPTPGPLPPPPDTTAPPPDTTTAPPPDTTTAPPPDTTTAPPPDTTAPPPPDTTTAPPPDTTAPPPDTATGEVHGRLFRVRLSAAGEGTPEAERTQALVDTLRAHGVPVWRYTERVRGREATGYLVAALRNAADANTLGDYAAEDFQLDWEWEHIDKDEQIPAAQVAASEAFVELLQARSPPGRGGGKKNGPP